MGTNLSLLAAWMLSLAVVLSGCLHTSTGAGAGGTSIDVEYVRGERFDDAAADPITVFPAKFVCGEAVNDSQLTPGSYRTVINILNLSQFQKNIQWRFTDSQNAFPGASALIPSKGSIAMDCEFILRQFAGATNVDGVLEGFVVIEDLASTGVVRVSVVYTSLHKQIHDRPDLLPVRTADKFCELNDDRELIVTIRNQGEVRAPVSRTSVRFEGAATGASLLTPALNPGEQTALTTIAIPAGEGVHRFTIQADAGGQVAEVNEINNVVQGSCLIIN